MQTSLRGIAEKAARDKTYRFRNLFGMLNAGFLLWCWNFLNKKSASGVDRVSASHYSADLKGNITRLVERVKGGAYRAKLVLRRFIPKIDGKQRPLGIPATEDKLLQMGVAKTLEAIYEEDFLPCSFGYRPRVGALDAVKDLSNHLQFRGYNFIVEADIKSFFDKILHHKLIDMLSKRIDDKPFLGLIEKWLKAGILEKDMVIHPITGTPQGGIVSPILANIYLHYALDMWFEEVVKRHCHGECYICRYADDCVCAFQYEDDAEWFYNALSIRLKEFGLELAEDKTRMICFSRLHMTDKNSFEFLGFEYRWGKNRAGNAQLLRRTSRKKLRNSLVNFNDWCKKNRNRRLRDLFKELNAKLRGYYNYYGIRGNYKSLGQFFFQAMRKLFKWVNRRSHMKSYNWEGLKEILKYYGIERPRITEKKQLQLKMF
jgi:group II intron reverse transcriptase/maturase